MNFSSPGNNLVNERLKISQGIQAGGLCNNLEGWNGKEVGGMFKWEGTWVNLWLIHVDVW